MTRISKRKVVQIFLSGMLIVLLIFAENLFKNLYRGDLEYAFSICCIIAIVVFSFLFYCSIKLRKGIVNIYSLMLLMCFLFYFGQHVVILLGQTDILRSYYRSILDGRIPDLNRIHTVFFILISLLVLNIGVLIGSNTKKEVKRSRHLRQDLYNQAAADVARLILLVVILPTFYKYYMGAISTMQYGYDEALDMTTGTFALRLSYFLSYFFLPSIYILLITYANSRKKWIILLVYTIYAVLYLMTGSRFRVFESIIAILLIYNSRVKTIQWKDLFKFFLLGTGLIAVFSIIRDSREAVVYSNNLLELISNTWEKIKSEGLFTSVLIETGSTFQVIDIVLYKTPTIIPYSYGYSILGAFLMILPSFMRGGFDLNSVNTSAFYSSQYLSEIHIGMGSSFLAEAYHNFGSFSYLFIFLVGLVVGKLMSTFNSDMKTEDNFTLYKYVYISSILCFGVRTDLVSIPRYFVFYVLFLAILVNIFYSNKLKRQN